MSSSTNDKMFGIYTFYKSSTEFYIPWNNAFWPTAVVGEADSVNFVSASACHIGGPKGVNPGQKALLHGNVFWVVDL